MVFRTLGVILPCPGHCSSSCKTTLQVLTSGFARMIFMSCVEFGQALGAHELIFKFNGAAWLNSGLDPKLWQLSHFCFSTLPTLSAHLLWRRPPRLWVHKIRLSTSEAIEVYRVPVRRRGRDLLDRYGHTCPVGDTGQWPWLPAAVAQPKKTRTDTGAQRTTTCR